MEILSIQLKSKSNPNVFRVVSNIGEYLLHSDVIVKSAIKSGEVDKDLFFDAVSESETIIGFNLCVKYLGSRVKSIKQVKDYLFKKQFHPNAIDRVIKKLKEYKLLDDENYAKMCMNANKSKSNMRIQQKLMCAGVSKDLFQTDLDDRDEFESCLMQANKFLKNKVSSKQITDKLVRRLTYLGYNYHTIRRVLDKLSFVEEDI